MAIKEQKLESYFGREIAIDASMSIYQFLVVVGRRGTEMLTNEAGEVTSHLQGMFARTIRLMEAGIKPVYVFDGKPPDLKKQELAKRFSRRADATKDLNDALKVTKCVLTVPKPVTKLVRYSTGASFRSRPKVIGSIAPPSVDLGSKQSMPFTRSLCCGS
ncbi:UNVERIFIED_CONTAM: Flap endonuclease 1 [Sesamum indicum]